MLEREQEAERARLLPPSASTCPPDIEGDDEALAAVARAARGERLWPRLALGHGVAKDRVAAVRVGGLVPDPEGWRAAEAHLALGRRRQASTARGATTSAGCRRSRPPRCGRARAAVAPSRSGGLPSRRPRRPRDPEPRRAGPRSPGGRRRTRARPVRSDRRCRGLGPGRFGQGRARGDRPCGSKAGTEPRRWRDSSCATSWGGTTSRPGRSKRSGAACSIASSPWRPWRTASPNCAAAPR